MSGKPCNGVPTDQPYVNESRAFCEGLEVATGGGLVGDNPHPAGTRDAANWDKGFNAYNGGVGSPVQVCCAMPTYDGVP